jgi:apolipoprotein N-acyltransferase
LAGFVRLENTRNTMQMPGPKIASVDRQRPIAAGRSAKGSPQTDRSVRLLARAAAWRPGITLNLGLLGSVLLWAALPPLGWWPLAWTAPIPWLLIIRRKDLAGAKPYAALWVAGCCFWLGTVHWLLLPHPATSLGWLALSGYLGVYLPVFIGLGRIAVHRLRWPLMLAAPVIWTGLELAQAHLLTGFNMASLGQSQYRWIELIQISDLAGGYFVGFLVMFGAACLARALPWERSSWTVRPLIGLAVVLVAVLAYGHVRMASGERRPGPTISLIQGSIDTEMKTRPGEQQQVFEQYFALSQKAHAAEPKTDLIVWPETMFRFPLFTYTDDARVPPGEAWTLAELHERAKENGRGLARLAHELASPLLIGIDTIHYNSQGMERYNSALFVGRTGELGPRYDKMHPVLFGEYVPLAKRFPWLYHLTPLGGGIECGTSVPIVRAGGARLTVNICYESVLSHVIRGQLSQLRERGEDADVLVNLTNDGWFWGSSELDQHLICGVFRAIECRKPFLVAANTGFSAWIDADGRIVQQGPRQATGFIIARPELDSRQSIYARMGDWPAGLCLCACLGLAGVGLSGRMKRRKVLT